MTVFLSSCVRLSVVVDSDLRPVLHSVFFFFFFSKRTGKAVAAVLGFSFSGDRIKHLQFIGDEFGALEQENIWKKREISASRLNAKSSRYTDTLAGMKHISVGVLLDSTLIPVPRKSIISLSLPDSCLVRDVHFSFLLVCKSRLSLHVCLH